MGLVSKRVPDHASTSHIVRHRSRFWHSKRVVLLMCKGIRSSFPPRMRSFPAFFVEAMFCDPGTSDPDSPADCLRS